MTVEETTSPASPMDILNRLTDFASYSPSAQANHKAWFQKYILPSILPALNNSTPWLPNLTWDHLPIEPSLNISQPSVTNLKEKKTVRVGIEPVGPYAGTTSDPFNQRAAWNLLHELQRTTPRLDLSIADFFFEDFEIPETPQTLACLPSQGVPSHFCAFDLGGEDQTTIDTKIYFVLDRAAMMANMSPAELLEESVETLDRERGYSFSTAVAHVVDYLRYPGCPMSTEDVEMLAVDCKSMDRDPRLKIYAHTYDCRFVTVEHVLTMGGLMRSPETKKQLVMLEQSWHVLFNDVLPNDSSWKTCPLEPTRNLNNRPHEFIFSFEMRSGQSLPEIKFYLPLRFYHGSDAETAARLSQFFKMRGWNGMASTYEQSLRNILPSNDLDGAGGSHTYTAFAYSKKKGPYMTLYWQPTLRVARRS